SGTRKVVSSSHSRSARSPRSTASPIRARTPSIGRSGCRRWASASTRACSFWACSLTSSGREPWVRKGRSSARPEPRAPQDPSILSCGDAVRERSARAARRADESLDRGGPVWVRDRSPTHRERARPDPAAPRRGTGGRPRQGRSEAFPLRSLRDDFAWRSRARALPHLWRAQVLRRGYRATLRGVGRRVDHASAVSVTDDAFVALVPLLRRPYISVT